MLVIVALLATPLALLARAVEPGMPDCNGMCCLPHGGHHHAPVRNSSPEPQKDDRKFRVSPICSSLLTICPLDSSLGRFNRRAVSLVRQN
jgi:hypothetical protein